MNTLLDGFRYEQYGATTLADAVCIFFKEQITYGRIKGEEALPTMVEIAKTTGFSFYQARNVVERLVREGYAQSRPHIGTVVRFRDKNVLRRRVLIALPDVDTCRYYPVKMIVTMRRRLSEAGYAMSVVSFPMDRQGSLSRLKSELIHAVDLVIACRATPNVQKCLAESGVRHIFAFGDRPTVRDSSPWLRLSLDEALNQFADHCENAGVKHVTQVCFELDETLDAGRVLAANCVASYGLRAAAEGRAARDRVRSAAQGRGCHHGEGLHTSLLRLDGRLPPRRAAAPIPCDALSGCKRLPARTTNPLAGQKQDVKLKIEFYILHSTFLILYACLRVLPSRRTRTSSSRNTNNFATPLASA